MSIFGSAFGNQGISFSRAMTARQRLCSHMTPPQPFWVHRLANIYLRMNWPVFPNFPRDSSCPLLLTHTHHQSILRYFHFICLLFFFVGANPFNVSWKWKRKKSVKIFAQTAHTAAYFSKLLLDLFDIWPCVRKRGKPRDMGENCWRYAGDKYWHKCLLRHTLGEKGRWFGEKRLVRHPLKCQLFLFA